MAITRSLAQRLTLQNKHFKRRVNTTTNSWIRHAEKQLRYARRELKKVSRKLQAAGVHIADISDHEERTYLSGMKTEQIRDWNDIRWHLQTVTSMFIRRVDLYKDTSDIIRDEWMDPIACMAAIDKHLAHWWNKTIERMSGRFDRDIFDLLVRTAVEDEA
jgi:hypothetical protein